MPSEMRRPELPNLDHFLTALDGRLRHEAVAAKRAIPPRGFDALLHVLHRLVKPLAQSGAMALTAIAVIIAIGATPAATSGDLANPLSSPLSAPNSIALIESDNGFLDNLPQDDILAVQEADISDTPILLTE